MESVERVQPEKKGFSHEEIERINGAKERLQGLIDKAATTADMAVNNELMPELSGARLRKFLENIAKEANDIETPENSVDEIIAHLEWLGERVKLPGDIKKENIGKVLTEMQEKAEQEKAHQEITGDIDSQIENRKQKKKGGFLRM